MKGLYMKLTIKNSLFAIAALVLGVGQVQAQPIVVVDDVTAGLSQKVRDFITRSFEIKVNDQPIAFNTQATITAVAAGKPYKIEVVYTAAEKGGSENSFSILNKYKPVNEAAKILTFYNFAYPALKKF